MNGYTIRKGKVVGSARSRLAGQSVKFQRVGRTVVFDGPADLLPAKVRSNVEARLGV